MVKQFIELVEEDRHGTHGSIWVNIDEIIAIHVNSCTIYTNAQTGDSGNIQITEKSMQNLINEIKRRMKQ